MLVAVLIHPAYGIKKLCIARTKCDKLIPFKKFKVQKATLHQYHAILGPLVLIASHQCDKPALILFRKPGTVLRFIRLPLHWVGRCMLQAAPRRRNRRNRILRYLNTGIGSHKVAFSFQFL